MSNRRWRGRPTYIADLVATFLERADERFTVETATNAKEGLDRLTNNHLDCIASDYDLPGKNGIGFLEAVRDTYQNCEYLDRYARTPFTW